MADPYPGSELSPLQLARALDHKLNVEAISARFARFYFPEVCRTDHSADSIRARFSEQEVRPGVPGPMEYTYLIMP